MSTIEKPGVSREIQPASDLRIMTCRVKGIEVRDASATPDGTWTMSGYAAVFDTDAVIYDGAYWQMVESIDQHAFDNVLASPDLLTHFNFGHDMNRVMAATDVPPGVGNLTLRADPGAGLFFLATVDPEDVDAQACAIKMRSGVIKGASFAFTVARKQLTTTDMEDGREQDYVRILEIGNLYDVCACAQGAYPTASSSFAARAHGAAMLGLGDRTGQPDEGGHRDQPGSGGREDVSPGEGGVPTPTRDNELEALRRRARLARHTHRKVTAPCP